MSDQTQTKTYLQTLLESECPDSSYNPLRLDSVDLPEIVIQSASGMRIKDVEGKEYLDCIAGFGSLILGHHHKSYQNTLQSHLEQHKVSQGLGDVYASDSKVKLIQKLIEITPSKLQKAALAVTGSQAVELALKTAYLKTKQCGVLAFGGAYHGLDMGVLGLEGRGDFQKPFAHALPQSHVTHLPFGCDVQQIEKAAWTMQKSDVGIAAIIAEPIQGRGGVIAPPAGWLDDLSKVAKQSGCLLILDEIWTGMGRTGLSGDGNLLKSEALADLVCIGKGLGGGMPISAVLGTNEAFSAWPENKSEALHTGTFFGHALSCDVALATIEATQQTLTGREYFDFCAYMASLLPASSGFEVAGRGHLCGIRHGNLNASVIMIDLAHAGVLALPAGPSGKTLSLTPPLTITKAEADLLAQKIKKVTS